MGQLIAFSPVYTCARKVCTVDYNQLVDPLPFILYIYPTLKAYTLIIILIIFC